MAAPQEHLFSFQWEALISPHKQNIKTDKQDAWDLACNLEADTTGFLIAPGVIFAYQELL